jgi:hypothetical protein
MREGLASVKDKKQLKSILLVYMLVATSMLVVFPLSVPKASAQVIHLASADAEDGVTPYDRDGFKNGVVVWNPNVDHIISHPDGYTIEAGMTLNIPPLNYFFGDPNEHEITFQSSSSISSMRIDVYGTLNEHEITFQSSSSISSMRIDVYGTLITNTDGIQPATYTAFLSEGLADWDGIYFHSGSEGRIIDTLIKNATYGVVFEPGSKPMGVSRSTFENIGNYGMRMDGALGFPSIADVNFYAGQSSPAIGLDVANGNLNMGRVCFVSHGPGRPGLRISNASVSISESWFNGKNQSGNGVLIKGNSNGTILDQCDFWNGAAGEYYIRVDGSSNLISNSLFETSSGALTIIANENALGIPSHPILLNPSRDGPVGNWDDSFDNTTMNATGNSSVTLQWYMDVYAKDPDGNPLANVPVWVRDRNGDPAQPLSKTTDASGWARGFIVTELIQYESSVTNFNPFNVSALNNSIKGYTEPMMNMSKVVTVIVPFNPVPNIPPIVSQIDTPLGVQSGLVSIPFRLSDPDIGDDGNLSITVEFWDPINWVWMPATAHFTSGPTTNLNNNTLYTFVWDSNIDFQDKYGTDIKIKITPSDKGGPGTSNETGNFTVDNKPPDLISGPTVDKTNTIAIINWTVDEPANASVWYGLDGSLTNQVSGSTSSTFQSVTLTGLQQGRTYTYTINSIDQYGNVFSSAIYTFDTEVRIQLRKGWNMISIPPISPSSGLSPTVENVLAPIAGLYDAVQAYDLSDPSDPWKHNRPGKPYGNDLDTAASNMSLWIHMVEDTTFPDQLVPDPGYLEFIPLVKGWNFVGYPSVTTRLIDNALAGVPYDMVQTYDAVTDQWLGYDGSFGSLTQMETGRGYWIHATADHDWQVNYV